MRRADDPGFTLVEILVAIVLVGILAAVVVVGIGNMTDHASAATCAASADAARTATTSYLVNNALYPATFADLTRAVSSGAGAPLVVPAAATIAGRTRTVGAWRLTMSAAVPQTFSCSTYSTVVVDTAHPGSWSFAEDNTALGNPGQLVTGPPTPPAGTGSAQLNVAGATQGSILSTTAFASTRLDKLTNLSYSTFQPPGSPHWNLPTERQSSLGASAMSTPCT